MMAGDRTILLIEDDAATASAIARLLRRASYRVDGPYDSLSDGMAAMAARFPDGAIIDADFDSESIDLLAADLDLYDIPYIVCADDGDRDDMNDHPAAHVLDREDLGRLVSVLSDSLH